MEGKLILVEGLPGSGKSSTAQFLCDQLQRNGHRARWYYQEETPHPVAARRGLAGPEGFQEYSRTVRRGWRAFARRTARGRQIALVESHFLQDAMLPLLREDVQPELIAAHVQAVAKIIQPLDPVLLYLHQPEYAPTLRRICDQRGPQIEKAYVSQNEGSRYGQRHGLTGFDGLVRFWVDLRAIAEQVFGQLEWRKLAIDNTAWQWTDYYRQICDFLSLTLQVDETLRREEYLRRYAGTYTYQRPGPPRRVGGGSALYAGPPDRRVGGLRRLVVGHYQKDIEFAIRLEGGELVMHGYGWLWPANRLIPKEKDVFHIASFPFHLVFQCDGSGKVVGATRVNPFGRWLVTGQEYPRVSEGKGDPSASPASRPAPGPRGRR